MNAMSVGYRSKRVLPLLLCLLLALGTASPALAASRRSEGKTVRVGWFDSVFNSRDRFGRCSGYAYEYQQKIAAYTGWHYEYVEESWPRLLEMLQAGELDLLSDVSFTEERTATMRFSSLPMGAETYYVFTHVGSSSVTAEDITSLNGKRVGVNKNSVQAKLFRDWLAENRLSAELVELTVRADEANAMLERGELDALVSISTDGSGRDLVPAWKIGQSDFYFEVNRARPDLLGELNAAMSKIQDENRTYNQQMYDKYVRSAATNPYLTAEEAAWLGRHGAIRVGYRDSYLPFCAQDSASSGLTGALKEYLALASGCLRNADVTFEAVPCRTPVEALAALRDGEIDCVFPVSLSDYDGEQLDVLVTTPFMHTEMFAYVRKTDRQGLSQEREMTVAVIEGNPNDEAFIRDHFPDWRTAAYGGVEDCFRAVGAAEADCVLVSSYRAAEVEQLREERKLVSLSTGGAMDFSFAVRRSDSELYYILNKLAGLVPEASVDSALLAYSRTEKSFSLTDYLREHRAALTVFLLAAALLAVLRINRRSHRARQELEQRLALQNQLLEQEREKHQSDEMITALASDYRSVYYIDLDKDVSICYRANNALRSGAKKGDTYPFREGFRKYAEMIVSEQDREDFLRIIDPDHIRAGLAKEPVLAHRFQVLKDGRESYEMIRIADVRQAGDREDAGIHAICAGFSNVDRETRESMEKNRALSDALRQAQGANAAKTAFLNSMSHEIRTPMNAIIGLNTIALREPGLSARARDCMEKIGSSAQHLLGLINSILDMSRIESGRLTLQNEPFSLRELLEQANAVIRGQCEEKGLQYDCRMPERLDESYIGDGEKLRQVILSILGNAVQFTPAPGTVTMSVEQTARFEDNVTLHFIVQDTGVGMDSAFLPKIFDVFAQEDENRANKYGSTGLGLAIAKNIVESMNGKIEVTSEKGAGSTFTVTVTLKAAEDLPQAGAGEAEEARVTDGGTPAGGRAELSGKRVLLAEDLPINAEILMDLLEMRDMTADHAENGRIAVDLFRESPVNTYAAILMDVRMPVLDGLGAAEAIRAMDRPDAKTIPIIAVTANAFDEDVQRSLQAGMNAHLNKPVDPERLFETLETLIRD